MIGYKNIVKNNYIIQANDSIMCRYFCIRFFDFITKNDDDSNWFYPNEYEKNDKIIVEYFQYPETKKVLSKIDCFVSRAWDSQVQIR